MALIAAGTVPPIEDEPPIDNNGFWPAIDPAAMRLAHKLDGTVTPARLFSELVLATIAVNGILYPWQATQEEAGHDTLEDVPPLPWHIDGQAAALYTEAVYCHAHAKLVDHYRDLTATGRTQDDTLLQTEADTYRAKATNAISALLGESNWTADLI